MSGLLVAKWDIVVRTGRYKEYIPTYTNGEKVSSKPRAKTTYDAA